MGTANVETHIILNLGQRKNFLFSDSGDGVVARVRIQARVTMRNNRMAQTPESEHHHNIIPGFNLIISSQPYITNL